MIAAALATQKAQDVIGRQRVTAQNLMRAEFPEIAGSANRLDFVPSDGFGLRRRNVVDWMSNGIREFAKQATDLAHPQSRLSLVRD